MSAVSRKRCCSDPPSYLSPLTSHLSPLTITAPAAPCSRTHHGLHVRRRRVHVHVVLPGPGHRQTQVGVRLGLPVAADLEHWVRVGLVPTRPDRVRTGRRARATDAAARSEFAISTWAACCVVSFSCGPIQAGALTWIAPASWDGVASVAFQRLATGAALGSIRAPWPPQAASAATEAIRPAGAAVRMRSSGRMLDGSADYMRASGGRCRDERHRRPSAAHPDPAGAEQLPRGGVVGEQLARSAGVRNRAVAAPARAQARPAACGSGSSPDRSRRPAPSRGGRRRRRRPSRSSAPRCARANSSPTSADADQRRAPARRA